MRLCLSSQRLRDDHLVTPLTDEQLSARLYRFALNAKEALAEQGVSTLFAAFGFLKWYESDDSQAVVSSPLLLTPVGLASDPALAVRAQVFGAELPFPFPTLSAEDALGFRGRKRRLAVLTRGRAAPGYRVLSAAAPEQVNRRRRTLPCEVEPELRSGRRPGRGTGHPNRHRRVAPLLAHRAVGRARGRSRGVRGRSDAERRHAVVGGFGAGRADGRPARRGVVPGRVACLGRGVVSARGVRRAGSDQRVLPQPARRLGRPDARARSDDRREAVARVLRRGGVGETLTARELAAWGLAVTDVRPFAGFLRALGSRCAAATRTPKSVPAGSSSRTRSRP